MLTAQVENPMMAAPWWEKPPDVTCPHCGAEWRTPEDTPNRHNVLSQSGNYCIDCLEEACGTDAALLAWYQQDVDRGDLMRYYFRDAYGLHFSGSDPDVSLLLDMLQEHRPDTFMELLRDYSRSTAGSRRASYWMEFLKENN